MNRTWLVGLILPVLTFAGGAASGLVLEQPPKPEALPLLLEAVPERLAKKLEERRQSLMHAAPGPLAAPNFVVRLTKRWEPGQTIKVAFRGGSDALHDQIASVVSEWTEYANLKFDFGRDPATGKSRTWTAQDASFAADIRISFDQRGYYSLVGQDSVDPDIVEPNQESLNFERFDRKLPADWKGVALHEFGHAIGFEHEHQGGPACDFRFEDDPGYVRTQDGFGQFVPDAAGRRPGLYTSLGGPPNNWTREVVDHNLKQLPPSSSIVAGPFDKASIMKYYFDESMFTSGRRSECYTDFENVTLSAQDKVGAAQAYPRDRADVAGDIMVKTKLFKDMAANRALPTKIRDLYQKRNRDLDAIRKRLNLD